MRRPALWCVPGAATNQDPLRPQIVWWLRTNRPVDPVPISSWSQLDCEWQIFKLWERISVMRLIHAKRLPVPSVVSDHSTQIVFYRYLHQRKVTLLLHWQRINKRIQRTQIGTEEPKTLVFSVPTQSSQYSPATSFGIEQSHLRSLNNSNEMGTQEEKGLSDLFKMVWLAVCRHV